MITPIDQLLIIIGYLLGLVVGAYLLATFFSERLVRWLTKKGNNNG